MLAALTEANWISAAARDDLIEAYRVLRRGGRVLCLEFSQVDVPGLDRFYDSYSFAAVPALGKLVTGDGQPYRYLVESIRKFPDMPNFQRMIGEAGFVQTKVEPILGGLVAIHSGWKV
jgi:demethylmenaquinone methyltransferase/2-methoxy-6-polyprenyl-1,4-benzoquinol methylase